MLALMYMFIEVLKRSKNRVSRFLCLCGVSMFKFRRGDHLITVWNAQSLFVTYKLTKDACLGFVSELKKNDAKQWLSRILSKTEMMKY